MCVVRVSFILSPAAAAASGLQPHPPPTPHPSLYPRRLWGRPFSLTTLRGEWTASSLSPVEQRCEHHVWCPLRPVHIINSTHTETWLVMKHSGSLLAVCIPVYWPLGSSRQGSAESLMVAGAPGCGGLCEDRVPSHRTWRAGGTTISGVVWGQRSHRSWWVGGHTSAQAPWRCCSLETPRPRAAPVGPEHLILFAFIRLRRLGSPLLSSPLHHQISAPYKVHIRTELYRGRLLSVLLSGDDR